MFKCFFGHSSGNSFKTRVRIALGIVSKHLHEFWKGFLQDFLLYGGVISPATHSSIPAGFLWHSSRYSSKDFFMFPGISTGKRCIKIKKNYSKISPEISLRIFFSRNIFKKSYSISSLRISS